MKDFQQRKKVRRVLYSRNVIIVLSIITILLVRGAFGVMQKNIESKKNVALLNTQLEDARVKNQELTKNIAILSTEEGVESEIRQKFSVSKDGEQVAVIVDPKPVPRDEKADNGGLWGSVKSWFLGLFGK